EEQTHGVLHLRGGGTIENEEFHQY
ncbi:MAG: hypothetical protein RL013_2238, partial [Bacteroidota bacterium]